MAERHGTRFMQDVPSPRGSTELFSSDAIKEIVPAIITRDTPAMAQRGSQISAARATIDAPITKMTPAERR